MPSERKPTGPSRRSVKTPPTVPPRRGTSPTTKVSGARTGAASSTAKKGSTRPSGKKKRSFWNYPRRGKGPIRRWLPSWRFLLASGLALFALGAGVFFYLYATTDVPEPEDVALAQSSTVYFADGTTEMGSFAEVDRTIIDATTLPPHVGQAVVASEDRRFRAVLR